MANYVLEIELDRKWQSFFSFLGCETLVIKVCMKTLQQTVIVKKKKLNIIIGIKV